MISQFLKNPTQTRKAGIKIGTILESGQIVRLNGPLGAGKTALAQGICAGLGVEEQVTSPTYTLVNEYFGRMPVFHMDLYRLSGSDEFIAMGGEEYFTHESICLIEWSERIEDLLPPQTVTITLEFENEGRRMTIEGLS